MQQNSFLLNDDSIKKLLDEIKGDQKISPLRDINDLKGFVKQGIYDIEYYVGKYINFDEDLQARDLLKNYVLFSDHNLKSKFKEEYQGEYIGLQIKYNRDSVVQ